MTNFLVLTVISDDKPGVVEVLAKTIGEHGGNWLECRMSHLAGKFAGILRVSVEEDKLSELSESLQNLHSHGLKVIVETAKIADNSETAVKALNFNLVGNDRPGIVRELAQALACRQINVDELNTDCSSMPWSGEPMFTASGLIQIPTSTNMDELQDQLDSISDELSVDITLEEPEA